MTTKQKNENKFICAFCNKTYIRKSAYNNHLITCKLCRFSSNCNKTESAPVSSPVPVTIDALKKDMTMSNLFAMVIMLYSNNIITCDTSNDILTIPNKIYLNSKAAFLIHPVSQVSNCDTPFSNTNTWS